jgi:alpha-beta hydrolase superfamily lysophospholipase
MGAWIATLAAIRLARECGGGGPAGLVLIAPAIDFTERLMWDVFPADIRETIEREGVFYRPSLYSDEPYPITRNLIEDGRRHLILGAPVQTGAPVHILQGMRDPDVPWEHAMSFVERLPGEDVQVTLVKDGDHRLSRPEDIDRLIRAVDAMLTRAAARIS